MTHAGDVVSRVDGPSSFVDGYTQIRKETDDVMPVHPRDARWGRWRGLERLAPARGTSAAVWDRPRDVAEIHSSKCCRCRRQGSCLMHICRCRRGDTEDNVDPLGGLDESGRRLRLWHGDTWGWCQWARGSC